MRPCLGCGVLTHGSRCGACKRPRAAHRAAYNLTDYRKAREALKSQYPHVVCYVCERPGADTLDHVVSLAKDPSGGGQANWLPAHRACNSRKGA